MSRKPENATAGEETAAESRVRVNSSSSGSDLARLWKMEFRKLKKTSPISTSSVKKGEKVRLQIGMQSSFIEMCEKSMEQDNARFERSAEMFRDAQSRQMEQTNAIVDIFKDLASK